MTRVPCILLVEDDPSMSTLLSYNLRQAGYEVLTAADGTAGLEAAVNYAVDLVLLDIMLPQLDGLSVSSEIARQKPGTPVVMITALRDRDTVLAGFGTGAVDFVTKPFDLDELLARVHVHLRDRMTLDGTAQSQKPEELCGLVIDRDAHVVRWGDAQATLRHKELELLSKLVSAPGHLFTREELVQAVWHQKYEPVTRSLDVHIRRLRVRLGEIDAPTKIESVRGVGYRIVIGP